MTSARLRVVFASLALTAGCGSRTGLLDVDDLSDARVSPDAVVPPGRCVRARVPDFNGDGVGDFAIVSRAGVLVYHGARGVIPSAPARVIPFPPGITAESAVVSCVGDLDGDGTSEIALARRSAQSTPDLPNAPYRAGDLFIVSGSRMGGVPVTQRVVAPVGFESNFPGDTRYAGTYATAARGAFVVSLTGGRGAFVFARADDGTYVVQGAAPIESDAGGAYASVFARGVGDVDGDGRGDLAVATDGAALLYSAGQRRVLYTDVSNRVGPYLDGVGDVTRDGCEDMLLLRFADRGSLAVFAGGAGFGAPVGWAPRAPGGRAVSFNGTTDFLPVGDVDGDGADDVLLYGTCLSGAPCTTTYERLLYRGGPAGLGEAPLTVPTPPSRGFTQRSLGDLDGDGRAELGELARGTGELTVWRGTMGGYTAAARVMLSPPNIMGASGSFTGSVP